MTATPPLLDEPEASPPPPADRPIPPEAGPDADRRQGHVLTLVGLILVWTFVYNVLIKGQPPVTAFFKIIDTISDDFVLGSLATITVGAGIVIVFSLTKLYSQIMANVHSFRMLETMLRDDLPRWRFRELAIKLLNFRDQPRPDGCCPTRVWGILLSAAFIYGVSWIYLVLFSEALFFVSWSAGVDLPINEKNLVLMPTLALSIPFSARVMAYLRYPYAADYADFMPGAVFVLLVVAALGFLFDSDDQQFYLKRVFENPEYAGAFLKNGVFLAFIPVFFEAVCWIVELNRPAEAAEHS
jgi:hypothetical protein